MTNNLEKIAQSSDRLENFIYGLQLPIAPGLHLQGLKEGLPEVLKEIRDALVDETGENPWEFNPENIKYGTNKTRG